MTSFAFILGVVPLAVATGAGAEMRQSLGTAVFFGMLGVTFFGLIFTPVFYVVVRGLFGRRRAAAPKTSAAPLVAATRYFDDVMSFYDQIEPVKTLDDALDPARYTPAPADWRLVITDIERSTEAIERGLYKTVNMISAACIAAVRNSYPKQELPFSFGGDGATLLIPPAGADAALAALAGVQALASAAGLTLRVGAMSVGELRARGHEVMIARYEVGPGVTFAMFRGGSVGFLDRVIKGQEPGVPASLVSAPTEIAAPDLTGLSCRFEPIASHGGRTVSVVVATLGEDEDFRPVLGKLLEIAGENLQPISAEALAAVLRRSWLPKRESIKMELDATDATEKRSRLRRHIAILLDWLRIQLSLRLGIPVGGHDAKRELGDRVRNSDFGKADDALMMVIDCTPHELSRIEACLTELEAAGVLVFGLHVADSALMTCLVDSAANDWHVHFIDGADGGYTRAAKVMKEKLAKRASQASNGAAVGLLSSTDSRPDCLETEGT
jgi:hypothetical protein